MRQEIAAKTKDGSASQGLAGAKDEIQKSREQATQYLAEIVAFRGDSCGLEAPVLGLQGSARRSCQTGKDEEFIRKSFTKTSEEIQDILSFAVNLVKDGRLQAGSFFFFFFLSFFLSRLMDALRLLNSLPLLRRRKHWCQSGARGQAGLCHDDARPGR